MMLNQSTCRYIYTLAFSLLALCVSPAYAQGDIQAEDTAMEVRKVKKPDSAGHQLCLGVDILNIGMNSYYDSRFGYDFEADYYLRNEFYLAVEGGWGGSTVSYNDLKYKTDNNFFRAGFNKCILARDGWRDWDMMFFGMRIGEANVTQSAVTYVVLDPFWGNTSAQILKGRNYAAVWAELTGGMRVELVHGLFAGWTMRGKFIMNGKSFKDLSPLYIAGYGKGDKNANFDLNVYISYGIRWERKSLHKSKGVHVNEK